MRTEKCSNHEFLLEQLKNCQGERNLTQKLSLGLTTWKVMRKNVLKDIVNWPKKAEELHKVSSPCLDDHHFKKEELDSVGELPEACSQIVLKCQYLARIGRPDILWSVNKSSRSVTKWIGACDRRLVRFISYIHHTIDYRQCHVGNTAQHCRWDLFQDSDFAGNFGESSG